MTRSIQQATYSMVTMVPSAKFSHFFPPSDFESMGTLQVPAPPKRAMLRGPTWIALTRPGLSTIHSTVAFEFWRSQTSCGRRISNTVPWPCKKRLVLHMLWPQSARPRPFRGPKLLRSPGIKARHLLFLGRTAHYSPPFHDSKMPLALPGKE